MVKRDIAVTILVRCMCVRASVRIFSGHKFYIYADFFQLFGKVVDPEEGKCHLKHFM